MFNQSQCVVLQLLWYVHPEPLFSRGSCARKLGVQEHGRQRDWSESWERTVSFAEGKMEKSVEEEEGSVSRT